MALTPLEIHNKEFPTRMRGFDQDEVNEFLDQVIRDYELLIRENKELKDNLEIVNKKLMNYEEMQDSLNKSILVAQDAADRLRENTDKEIEVIQLEAQSHVDNMKQEAESYAADIRKEADQYSEEKRKKADEYAEKIHNQAEDNADTLLEEAVLKARKIEDETEALRKQSRVFRQRLQLLVESQLDLLVKEDWDNVLVGKPIEYPNIDTIAEVEKELEEKVEVQPTEEAADEESVEDYDQAEDNDYEENEEVVAFEDSQDGEEVAFSDDDQYNSDDSEYENDEADEEEYVEGSMPAVELPETSQK